MYKFTLYRTSVIILTPPPLHPYIHLIVKLCRKGVLQTKREVFFENMFFRFFLWDGELRTFVGREFQILAAWKWKDLFPADLRLVLGTFNIFHCWTEEFERVGRCEAVLKSTEEENSQSAWKLVWQFCSGYGPQRGASVVFPEGE